MIKQLSADSLMSIILMFLQKKDDDVLATNGCDLFFCCAFTERIIPKLTANVLEEISCMTNFQRVNREMHMVTTHQLPMVASCFLS